MNLCSVCNFETDGLNNKKRDLRNSNEQKNKQLCLKCSDITPAHIFHLIKNDFKNFDKVESRLNNLEKMSEYVANSVKTLINSYNTLEQISEEVHKTFNKFDEIESKCIIGYDKLDELFHCFNRNNNKVQHSLETLADVSSRLEDNLVSNSSSNHIDLRDSHSNNFSKCLLEISSKLDQIKKIKINPMSLTPISKKDIAVETDTISEDSSQCKIKIINNNGGWRLIGEKRIWKSDWSSYDKKTLRYTKAENHRMKQRKRKQKQKNQKKLNSTVPVSQKRNQTLVSNDSANFRTTLPSKKKNLLKSSINSVACLNDQEIYNITRNYLAFLHDQPPSVAHQGMTCISAKVRIGAEGLPTDYHSLRKLYDKHNSQYKITQYETQADLDAVRFHLQASAAYPEEEEIPTSNKGFQLFTQNRDHFGRFFKESRARSNF